MRNKKSTARKTGKTTGCFINLATTKLNGLLDLGIVPSINKLHLKTILGEVR